jgi:hypothetical protein
MSVMNGHSKRVQSNCRLAPLFSACSRAPKFNDTVRVPICGPRRSLIRSFKIARIGICERLLNFGGINPMATEKKAPSKRELIEPTKGDKRYVRRKADGTFGKTVDVGKSLAADRKQTAKKKVPKGQGDQRIGMR